MRATQTFQKQTMWPLTKLGIPQLPHYPMGVKRVHVNSPNVEGTVFQIFLNYKQCSCIQFITNEQVKLISFIWKGVDFTLGVGIRYVLLKWIPVPNLIKIRQYLLCSCEAQPIRCQLTNLCCMDFIHYRTHSRYWPYVPIFWVGLKSIVICSGYHTESKVNRQTNSRLTGRTDGCWTTSHHISSLAYSQ